MPRLIVLRGNSASGKSSVAAGLRDRFGRGLALVAQDNLRRVVLRERDRPGAANIGLIDLTARYALDAGFHVVVEGLLYADHYGEMLTRYAPTIAADYGYYLHVPFGETLARHATKPQANEIARRLRAWYRNSICCPTVVDLIDEASTLTETVERIMTDTVWLPSAIDHLNQQVIEARDDGERTGTGTVHGINLLSLDCLRMLAYLERSLTPAKEHWWNAPFLSLRTLQWRHDRRKQQPIGADSLRRIADREAGHRNAGDRWTVLINHAATSLTALALSPPFCSRGSPPYRPRTNCPTVARNLISTPWLVRLTSY
uniref:(78-11) Lincomycin production genes n=1 Tax=Streptomyces lincolnensis TaxID=1915 RepID=Q54383_STRLN|nr:unnamed protein product [Streptomyces lincolnensis]